jgi:tRNA dimethylallyltransferase
MVGGTGLYIKAFCEGMDDVAAVDPAIRQKMIADYNEKGLEFLQKHVLKKIPISGKLLNSKILSV